MSDQEYIRNRILVEDRGFSTPCWVWKLATLENGYGRLFPRKGENVAHRVAYRAFVGEIPDGLQIDHLCRVRSCCNPAHLEAVTRLENVRRAFAAAAPKTMCRNGHSLEQTGRLKGGGCKACQYAAQRRWIAAQRSANQATSA